MSTYWLKEFTQSDLTVICHYEGEEVEATKRGFRRISSKEMRQRNSNTGRRERRCIGLTAKAGFDYDDKMSDPVPWDVRILREVAASRKGDM